MMTNPLGIDDLLRFAVRYSRGRILPSEEPEHYVWCRVHEQARKNTERCLIKGTQYEYPPDAVCITVGPFTSKREANRLAGKGQSIYKPGGGDETLMKPLGMEIE